MTDHIVSKADGGELSAGVLVRLQYINSSRRHSHARSPLTGILVLRILFFVVVCAWFQMYRVIFHAHAHYAFPTTYSRQIKVLSQRNRVFPLLPHEPFWAFLFGTWTSYLLRNHSSSAACRCSNHGFNSQYVLKQRAPDSRTNVNSNRQASRQEAQHRARPCRQWRDSQVSAILCHKCRARSPVTHHKWEEAQR